MKSLKAQEFATKKELNALRREMRRGFDFFFKKFLEHDERFDRMESKLDMNTHVMQQMCDAVLKAHENFSVESAAIKDSYQRLEARVTKVESVVFPNG